MSTMHEELFYKMEKVREAIRDARDLAKDMDYREGLYYSDSVNTSDVLDRYFKYHTDMEPEKYWNSSSATC